MKIKDLTCIGCPLGCMVHVEMEGNDIIRITGNHCSRGDSYARNEVTNPLRTVTSSIPVLNGQLARVSVKTVPEIPKERIPEIMNIIHQYSVSAPVQIRNILIKNIAGTDSDLVATRSVPAKKK